MVKILQFGEGNFLRTFVDLYFDTLNKEGGDYGVTIVRPIKFGDLGKFARQNNKYNIVLRGQENGKETEKVYPVESVKEVFCPFENNAHFYELARDNDLKIIVSNTTEAGICYNESDVFEGFDNITYPAKLTKFLLERFNAGLDGLYVLPVELIDNNAEELYNCVKRYIKLWNLSKEFGEWIEKNNFFCGTLVDRIVSGYPKTERDIEHIDSIIGFHDELVSIGEPFGLWVIEDKGGIGRLIKDGVHNIKVILTDDIKYYKKRKVRVLNGSHTNIVPVGLWKGKDTVYDCMTDKTLVNFLNETLKKEIIPFVSDDINATKEFADSVKDRFMNQYLNHKLISISLNGISKWAARNLPSFKDYYKANGKIAANMTVGFSYLMYTYTAIKEENGKYYVEFPSGKQEIKDDIKYLDYFAKGNGVKEFMSDSRVWGEDLTSYKGFAEAVISNIEKLNGGKELI